MGALARCATGRYELRRAWEHIRTNVGPEGPSWGLREFETAADKHLRQLARELKRHQYAPGDLFEVAIAQRKKTRQLHIPPVRDRVLARSILSVLQPSIDPLLGASSFAYRPGLSVADAVTEVVRLRDEGCGWVLRADIRDCFFPSTPVGEARARLDGHVTDARLLSLVDQLMSRRFRSATGHRQRLQGLPQGCPLSPLLLNLLLAGLDDALSVEGLHPVRYADDICVACGDRDQAWYAKEVIERTLAPWRMTLNPHKTDVMSFETGFTFLGEDFGPKYPTTAEARTHTPPRRVVYLGAQGSRSQIRSGRLRVSSASSQPLLDIPSGHVARLVCYGAVALSAGVRSWALTNNVEVIFVSRRGTYMGQLVRPGNTSRISRIRAQLAFQDSTESVDAARAIVRSKILHQQVLLRRFSRPGDIAAISDSVHQISRVLARLDEHSTLAHLMGAEGAAARAYFSAYGRLLPEQLRFTARTRRPPADVPNAALSYLYAVLLGECVTALYAAGVDPAIGILHSNEDSRPNLALDLMEEFRPMVVDQVVLHLARRGSLTLAHGAAEADSAGVLLTKRGREVVLAAYEQRMLRHTKGALPGFAGSVRRHVYRQAERLQATISRPEEPWTGLSWRP